LVIATKHSKENVLAPILESSFAIKCSVPDNFDSDLLGTFTGEVERNDDPLSTARKKCLLAMELTGCDLALASEGSFGPHPSFFMVGADEEILMFLDKKNDLEVVVRHLSIVTNFNAAQVNSLDELLEFAEQSKFPSHALILRPSKNSGLQIIKDITNFDMLRDSYTNLFEKYGIVYVETDMRAMNNPTRMRVIKEAAEKLVEKLKSKCPNCSSPGFGITDFKRGLPCEVCGFLTQSVSSAFYTCVKCKYSEEHKFPNNKYSEDPQFCDNCNP
jgi:hypothetical protein